jgi:hypothetical protein
VGDYFNPTQNALLAFFSAISGMQFFMWQAG